MSTIEIVTERLSLRPFQVDDLEAFVAYRSDPQVARYQSWDPTYSMADAESFLSSQREQVFGQPGDWLQLAIVDRETATVCGDCAVRVATDQPATAEIGITLAQSSQGKGLATEALTAVVTELFEQRGMHRVFAEADDRNVPVRRLLERLGFRCEGRLVEADWFKGEWSTLRLYAMLDREWAGAPEQRCVASARVEARVRTGGCLCGSVRYSVRGDPVHVRRCHCANCRKESGSAFTVYAHWPVEAFELSGEIASYDGRGFCPRCGSRLLDTADPDDTFVEIRIGSLDEAPFELKPKDEVWVKRRESWIPPVEGAAQHDEEELR